MSEVVVLCSSIATFNTFQVLTCAVSVFVQSSYDNESYDMLIREMLEG
jgi:hypothetical protein